MTNIIVYNKKYLFLCSMKDLKTQYDELESKVLVEIALKILTSDTQSERVDSSSISFNVSKYREAVMVDNEITIFDAAGYAHKATDIPFKVLIELL